MNKSTKKEIFKIEQYALFFFFSCLSFYLIKEHIFYRDDARPVLMAITSNSFLDLFNNVRYESNPMLYHLLLWLINKITPVNVYISKALFLLINITTIFIIAFMLRIPNIYRLLILVQVPQLGLLSCIRQYSLAVLFFFIFTHLYMKSRDKNIWIYITLFFLCQCCFHSMIGALGLYVFMISERYFHKEKIFKTKDLILLTGIILCSIQMIQPKDLIVGLKEFKPLFTEVSFFFTLHFIYDTLLSNPFSGIVFIFFIYKTFNKLRLENKILSYGFIVPIYFILLLFYFICTLKGYSTEKHFWMFSYTAICLLLITNYKDLKIYLQNKLFLKVLIFVIASCIIFDAYTIKKHLSSANGAIELANYLDKNFPDKITLQKLDFLSDAINVYRKDLKKYYSLNAQRFNYFVKWNDPRTDFTQKKYYFSNSPKFNAWIDPKIDLSKNKSKLFTVKASQLISDIKDTPEAILNTEPIVIIAGDCFINDFNTDLNDILIKNKYKLIFKTKYPGSRSDNYFIYQLIKI